MSSVLMIIIIVLLISNDPTLNCFSISSSYRRSSRLQRLNNMGRQSIFYLWTFFTDWARFGHGPFWLESWAILDIDVGRFVLLLHD